MKAIYAKHGSILEDRFNDLSQAIEFLNDMEDFTLGYALSIYDEQNRIAYLPKYIELMEEKAEDLYNARLLLLKERGMEPLATAFYK